MPRLLNAGGTQVIRSLLFRVSLLLGLVLAACSEPSRVVAPPSFEVPGPSFSEAQDTDTTMLASDAFSRVVAQGWGAADLGGPWKFSSSDLSMAKVSDGQGQISVPNTTARTMSLRELNVIDGSGLASFRIDRTPDNPNRAHTVDVYVRRRDVGMSSEQFYRYRVRAFGTGTMDLRVEKRAGGVNTWITSYTRIPAVWEAGGRYWIRWDCLESGSGTVIHMRVWRDGEAEPADWQIAKMENEPALAAGGVVGFRVAAPSADQVNFPITFAFDDFKLFTLVAPNTAPVADPGGPYVGVSGSPVGFDGSQSSDADNDVPLTYHWDFGDGSTSEEMAPNHTYAAAGTYAVTLTVTDSRGLDSEPATTSATIEENDPSVLVTDHFSRTVSDGWGTAEVGGSWLIDPWLRPDFRVNGTEGQIVAPDIGSRNVVPTDGYGLNVTGVASYIIDKAPDDPTGFHTVQVYARRDDSVTDGDNYYRYRVRNFGSGKVDLRVEKNVNGVLTWLLPDSKTVAAVFAPGKKFWIRWECTGTSPATVLRMRLWPDGSAEPSTWAMEVTVNEPALDVTGTTGFRVKTSNTNQVTFPITFSFDNLEYRLKE